MSIHKRNSTTKEKAPSRPKANLKEQKAAKQSLDNKEKIINDLSKLTDADFKKLAVDMNIQAAKTGLTYQEILGIPDDTLEEIYSIAYGFYLQGQYSQGYGLFQFLYSSNPTVYKYLFGLASCQYQMKLYDLAATSFFFSLALNPFDPIPAYYSADSFLLGELFTEANELFDITINICKDPLNESSPETKILLDKCVLLKESIKTKTTTPETYKKYHSLNIEIKEPKKAEPATPPTK